MRNKQNHAHAPTAHITTLLCTPLPQPATFTHHQTVSVLLFSAEAAGCESVLCLAREIVYFESVLGVQQVNEYLMTVPPLLSAQAQADDLLTFRHPGPDELLRAELSVTSAGPAPGGIERQGYL